MFKTNQPSSDPNQAGKQINPQSFSGPNSWLKNNNPMTKMAATANEQSPIFTTAVKLISSLSSGFYSLLNMGGSGSLSNDVSQLLSNGIAIPEKSFYASILSVLSVISSPLFYLGDTIYQSSNDATQKATNSLLQKNPTLAFTITIPVLGYPYTAGITFKSLLRIILSLSGSIVELIGKTIADVVVEIFGETYSYLVNNFFVETVYQFGEFIKAIGDALYVYAETEAQSFLPAWIIYILAFGVMLGSVIILAVPMINNLLHPLNFKNTIGSVFVLVSICLVILYSISQILVINREQLRDPP